MIPSRRQLLRLAGAGLTLPFVSLARGEAWPTRPIHAVVPIQAGTGVDIISRLVLGELLTLLSQPIVIENRPGASGTIGAAAVAKAAPDGYTLLADSASHTIVPALFAHLPYDPTGDFVPVVPLGSNPLVLVVGASSGFKSVEDLVAAAKARPSALTYASGGIGTTSHLAPERFRLSAGFEAVHVPFRGAAFSSEVMSGRIDFAFSPVGSVIELIRDGRLRPLAVASRERSRILPNVPTTLEAGYLNSDYAFWVGLFAPAKTPDHVVEQLNRLATKVMSNPKLLSSFATIGAEPMPMTAREFGTLVNTEISANAALARSIGLSAT
jgi:tripartite-type tricarboxylate transporter receptor subunit TctC